MKFDDQNQAWKRPLSDPLAAAYERRTLAFDGHTSPEFIERMPVSKTLASYRRFLVAGLIKQGQTGAVFPSQRFLISKMIAPVPRDYEEPIIELGAGTGAITVRLAARCPKARILACEIN